MKKLINIMKELRDPENGCPWDIEQTFFTIAPYTIEEAYEVADAIARENMEDLKEELGDLLFQVVFHAQMAAEKGAFDITEVERAIVNKMIRRHPHVFGDEEVEDAEHQTRAWEAHKEAEREKKAESGGEQASILDGVPLTLPGLTQAVKLQKRAARVGFDWRSTLEIFDKIEEELEEVRHEVETNAAIERIEDEIGDLFFAVSNLARHLDIDPEATLRLSNAKFARRFRSMESIVRENKQDMKNMSLEEMEVVYQQVKQQEKLTEDKG